jgi:hypothetical protein
VLGETLVLPEGCGYVDGRMFIAIIRGAAYLSPRISYPDEQNEHTHTRVHEDEARLAASNTFKASPAKNWHRLFAVFLEQE